MNLNKTLFGRIFFKYQTICGCIKYKCKDDCKLTGTDMKQYKENFYLGENYFGKINYLFYDSNNFLSDIKIISRNSFLIYHEQMMISSEFYYNLKINSHQIKFQDIPEELIYSLNKKKYKK